LTGTAVGSLLGCVGNLGVTGISTLAATGAALITSGALLAGFTAAAGALDTTAVLAAVFFAAGARALDAGTGVVFLVEVVTVFFGAEALVLACVLEINLGATAGFLVGATDVLAVFVALGLAAGTCLAAVLGLAFLVLVAFNSCLLVETHGPRLREVQLLTRPAGLPPCSARECTGKSRPLVVSP
jgi:hypothetical protein